MLLKIKICYHLRETKKERKGEKKDDKTTNEERSEMNCRRLT